MTDRVVSELYRTGDGRWAFDIEESAGRSTHIYATHDAALTAHSFHTRDEDAMNRALDEVMENHTGASVTPRLDGGWDVMADNEVHYVITPQGEVDVEDI